MRRLCLLLFLLPLMGVLADKTPFYIVDGVMGVGLDQMPPQEDIYFMTVMDSAEAVFVYGERAAGGAVVVQTKEYARAMHYATPQAQEENKKVEKSKEERIRDYDQRRRQRRARRHVFALLALALGAFEKWREDHGKDEPKEMTDEDFDRAMDSMRKPIIPQEKQQQGVDPLLGMAIMYVVMTRHNTIDDIRHYFNLTYQQTLNIMTQLEDYNVWDKADRYGKHNIRYHDASELDELFQSLGVEWEAAKQTSHVPQGSQSVSPK